MAGLMLTAGERCDRRRSSRSFWRRNFFRSGSIDDHIAARALAVSAFGQRLHHKTPRGG